VHGAEHLVLHRFAAADGDRLHALLHPAPAAVEPVLLRVGRVQRLDEDVLLVCVTGGRGPCQTGVMPDQHPWEAGKTHSDDVKAWSREMHLVGDLWRGEAHLGSADQNGISPRHPSATDHDRIAAPGRREIEVSSKAQHLAPVGPLHSLACH